MATDESSARIPLDIAPTLTLVDQLHADRRTRDERGLFFAEGVRNVVTAVDEGLAVHAVVYSERLLTSPLPRMLVRRLKRAGTPFARVSPEQFRAVSRTERASGVGLILRQRVHDLPGTMPGRACWVAVSHVRSPGNLGSLIRTGAAIGAAGFILLDPSIDPFDPVVVRATMGGLFRQTLVRADVAALRRWVKQHRVQVIGASPEGTIVYDRVRYAHRAVLMLGDERKGLSADQRGLCDQIVSIPMVAGDSLNLAVAGSLLLYEMFRASRRP